MSYLQSKFKVGAKVQFSQDRIDRAMNRKLDVFGKGTPPDEFVKRSIGKPFIIKRVTELGGTRFTYTLEDEYYGFSEESLDLYVEMPEVKLDEDLFSI